MEKRSTIRVVDLEWYVVPILGPSPGIEKFNMGFLFRAYNNSSQPIHLINIIVKFQICNNNVI